MPFFIRKQDSETKDRKRKVTILVSVLHVILSFFVLVEISQVCRWQEEVQV